MQTSFRIFQLLKIRNQMSSRTLRNYGLYSALVLLVIYNLADFAVDVGTLFLITLVLTSFVAAERQFFPQVKDTMNSIHFLTTPSQQWEKWLAEFIHTFFIIPIIAIIPVMSAVLIVKLFSFSANNLYISADGLYFAIKKYWIMHPLLFFGAIYFRHSVLIKTFGSIALLAIASGLFVAVLTNLFPAIDHENFALIYSQLPIVHFVTNPLFKIVSTLAYFLFFWGMSYLSLLEIEN